MSSTDNSRRHRAGGNPQGRPARELVDEYWAPAAREAQLARTA